MNRDAVGCPQRDLFGLRIDAMTMEQAVARCTDAIGHGEQLSIGVVNAAKIVAMRRDPGLRDAVTGSGMVLADGQSVVWASRLLGAPLPERVTGIDLFMQLLAEAERHGYRVYLLGAKPAVLARVVAEVTGRFPGLQIAGSHHGYYETGQEAEIAEDIRQCRTDMLFVGMSSPRKELFLDAWGSATKAHVVHGVGGSFDILAGVTRRAPHWYQQHGLEWLYRAQQEPVRLGRRYLSTNMVFIAMVGREMVRRDKAGRHRPARVEPGRDPERAAAGPGEPRGIA